jgi:hypothetical protein
MARPYDHTSLGGDARAFPATEWTKILSCPHRKAVLAELCQKYWKPVYCYLRGVGLGNDQAKDLTQGFFTEKVLGQDFAAKADREKGRFRNFLLRAVRNYVYLSSTSGTALEGAKSASKHLQERAGVGQGW